MDHDTCSHLSASGWERAKLQRETQNPHGKNVNIYSSSQMCHIHSSRTLRWMDSSPAPPYLQGENKGPVASDQLSPTPSCPEFFLPGRNTFVCASPHFPQQDGAPRGNRSLRGMEDMGGWKPWGNSSHRGDKATEGMKAMGGWKPQADMLERSLHHLPGQPGEHHSEESGGSTTAGEESRAQRAFT